MADPLSVISVVEGSIGLVLQCGSVAKTLSDMMTKFKNAEVAITSMIQEVETIQFAWNRIKEWSEEHAEAATDSSFVQRLEKSLQCGTLVLSALEQDLANYKHTADNSNFILRSKMAWNERAFLDHQHRVRGQVQAMTLMLQVSQLSTSKAQTKLLKKREKALRASDESAYSIVPSTMSSHMSVSTRSRTSISSIESKELVYYPLSFEDDLFTARVYKRNYRSSWVNTLSKIHRGKRTEERGVLGAELKALKNGSLLLSSATGTTTPTNMSVHFSQPWRSNQEISLPPSPALTAETKANAMHSSVGILDSIPPTSGKGLSIGSNLQNEVIDLTEQPDVVTAVDPASRHIAQRDKKSKVALARSSPAREVQYDMNLSLFQAVDEGDLDRVKALINQAAQISPQYVFEQLPIRLAISHHDVSMTKLLLQEGAKCAQEGLDTPPIYIACEFGDFKIVELLLDIGASAISSNAQQEQPLHTLLSGHNRSLDNSDLIKLLVSRGADVNARTGTNKTPLHLHLSCSGPNVNNVRSLLIHGAEPNSICAYGSTALHVLAKTNALRIRDCNDISAIFRLLHDHGADVNAEDKFGNTPLHIRAEWSCIGATAQVDAYVTFSNLLISHGANVNVQNNAGDTLLHVLVCQLVHSMRGWTAITATIQLLLQYRADVNIQNNAGDTPLHVLVCQPVYIIHDWTDITATIQLLLQHGADVNIQNNAGETLLHVLVCQPVYSRPNWTDITATIQLLLQHGADVNIQNKAGDTPLHVLVCQPVYIIHDWTDITATIQLLLQHRADVNIQNNAGDTPLHVLVCHPVYSRRNWTDITATIQLLLQHGAGLNIQNKAGDTPLHTFVAQFSDRRYDQIGYEVTQLLLQDGADVNIQNNAGDTPLDILARCGYSVENNAVVEKIN